MKNKYRIVTDEFAGYEAQIKYWWFPFCWFQMNDQYGLNTFQTVERAELFIKKKKALKRLIKYVD